MRDNRVLGAVRPQQYASIIRNASPAYVAWVAAAFDNGQHVRGTAGPYPQSGLCLKRQRAKQNAPCERMGRCVMRGCQGAQPPFNPDYCCLRRRAMKPTRPRPASSMA